VRLPTYSSLGYRIDSSEAKLMPNRGSPVGSRILEPALQGWGRPWVVCAPAVRTTDVVINNRRNKIFRCGAEKHSRGFGPYTPHGVPKGSVCIHSANSTFQFGARPGRSGIAYNATSGCLCSADGGNDDVSGLFHDF